MKVNRGYYKYSMAFVGDKYKMYCYDISGDSSEFELRFEVNGEIKEIQVEYCFQDVLIESASFLCRNCEKYSVDTRYDTLVVDLSYRF